MLTRSHICPAMEERRYSGGREGVMVAARFQISCGDHRRIIRRIFRNRKIRGFRLNLGETIDDVLLFLKDSFQGERERERERIW